MQMQRPSASSSRSATAKPAARRREAETQEEEEEEPSQSSQSSQATRSSTIMDPGQNMAERRMIRRNYRELIQKTTDVRQEYIRPESDGLIKVLEQGDELYQDVKMPREAALDSEFLSLTSQYGLEQTRRLQTGFKAYEIGDFITRVRTQLQGVEATQSDDLATQDLPSDSFDWLALGKKAASAFKATAKINFMYGPLNTEAKQKTVRKRVVREKRAELVRPEEVLDTQVEGEVETTRRVQELDAHLQKAKHIDYCKFVTNPKSFGQTVENIFHSAFLVKDGRARIINKDDTPILEPAPPPKESDYESGKAIRKQCVVRFDYSMWQKLREKHTDGVIPHRQPGTYEHPGLSKKSTSSQANNSSQRTKSNGKHKRSRQEESEEESESESDGAKKRKRAPRKSSNNNNDNNNNNNNKPTRRRKNVVSDSEEETTTSTARKSKGKERVYGRNTDYTEDETQDEVNESIGSPDVEGDNFVADSQTDQGYDDHELNDTRKRSR